MGELVWVRLFVPKLLKILYEFSAFVLFCSSQHYTSILFFFFFSARIFFVEITLQDIIFILKVTHTPTPHKSPTVGP